jgi:dGTP triphosphohydrolase
MGSEALEESVEELIGMVATNHVLNKKNESEDTLFEGHSREEIIKTMAETAVATAKGMVLGGLPTEAVNAVVDYNSNNTTLKRNANKFSGYDKDSYAVDASMIKAPKVKAEKDFSKFEAPVEVVRVDNQYVVKNPEDAGKLKAVLSQGAQALNVHVVNDVDAVNRMDAEESATRANNIAKNLEDAKVKNNQVIFKTPEEAKKRAKEFPDTSKAKMVQSPSQRTSMVRIQRLSSLQKR